jgi:hypothetical protein
MQAVGEEVLHFAGFTLDLRRGCVRADDREMQLRPKASRSCNTLSRMPAGWLRRMS